MDSIDTYREIIRDVLSQYINIKYANVDAENEAIFDVERDRYLVMSVGWGKTPKGRVHGCLLHIDIINGKVWIQRDGTEDGVARELLEAGIPKEAMVLGFHEPGVRPYTGFAVG
jgi:hypothetical protein